MASKWKILLDTNIIINREAFHPGINTEIGSLFFWLEKKGYEKWLHPKTIEELMSYKNKEAVKIFNTKLSNYNTLKTLSPDTEEILTLKKQDKDQNSLNDTEIIKELFNKRVEFLITEDRWIHKKAEILWIRDKVFSIEEFIHRCILSSPQLEDYKVLSVRKRYIGDINLEDPFFNSLRKSYPGFNERFNRKAQESAYVTFKKDWTVSWFLYIKKEGPDENYSDITPTFTDKSRLKIGTFKVSEHWYNLGERFLKIIFDNAIKRNVDEIYVTVFDDDEEKQRLISFLLEWGFYERGKKWSETVLVRDFSKNFNTNDPKLTFPYFKRDLEAFVCPIKPEYHTELLPDSILANEQPDTRTDSWTHRNAIRKIFISRSVDRSIAIWDLLLFYRTGWEYRSVITSVGIVTRIVNNISSKDEFIRLCGKRSVFSIEKLWNIWDEQYNKPFIIEFLYITSFSSPKINLKRLKELRILNSPPRWLTKLSADEFNLFLDNIKINEGYIVY